MESVTLENCTCYSRCGHPNMTAIGLIPHRLEKCSLPISLRRWKPRTKGALVCAELPWVRQAHLQIALEKDEGIDERGRMVQTEIVEAYASQCDTSASLQILLTFQDAQCESIFFSSQWRGWVLHWGGKGKWKTHRRIQEHEGRQRLQVLQETQLCMDLWSQSKELAFGPLYAALCQVRGSRWHLVYM